MTTRSTAHTSFIIERMLAAPPRRVFAAWSNMEAKRRWFSCYDDWLNVEYQLDFRVGGTEINVVTTPDGSRHAFTAHYLDIITDERIIYAYDMQLGERRISVSIATVIFDPAANGTKMTFTEHVAFLDGYSDTSGRIKGTEDGLDRLELELLARDQVK